MDPRALPFDADAMLGGLRPWIECESPTYAAAAVNRMMDIASRALIVAGGLIYSAGVPFYVWRSLKFQNAIWHACVALGAALQFGGVVAAIGASS